MTKLDQQLQEQQQDTIGYDNESDRAIAWRDAVRAWEGEEV